MSFVDVDSTAESIQEDEEVIEALEQFVETGLTWSKEQIILSLQETWESIVEWLEWLFPLWITYREDPSLFWQDLQRLVLSAVLLAISVLLLSPYAETQRRRRRRNNRRATLEDMMGRHSFRLPKFLQRKDSDSRRYSCVDLTAIGDNLQMMSTRHTIGRSSGLRPAATGAPNFRPPASSICSGRVILDEGERDETDQERFEKSYRSIQRSSYCRLVLPPECKLVEKPRRIELKKEEEKKKKEEEKKKKKRRGKRQKEEDFEENPLKRLSYYFENVKHVFWSFVMLDLLGAFRSMFFWLKAVIDLRKYRRTNSHPEPAEDDEDDDDESKASLSVATSASATRTNNNNNFPINSLHSVPHTPDRIDRPDASSQLYLDGSFQSTNMMMSEGEEKKESPVASSINMNGNMARTPPPLKLDQSSSTGSEDTKRRGSDSSLFSTPSQQSTDAISIGEADEGNSTSLRLPLSMSSKAQGSTAKLRPSVTGGKKKDLLSVRLVLENYAATFVFEGLHNLSLHLLSFL